MQILVGVFFALISINIANAEVRETTYRGSCSGVPGLVKVKEVLRNGEAQSVCLGVENLTDFDYYKNGYWTDMKDTFYRKLAPIVLHAPSLYEDNQIKDANGLFGYARKIERAPFPDRFLKKTISFKESAAGVKYVESRYADYGKYEDFFREVTCFLDSELTSKIISQKNPSLKEIESFSFCPIY
jgi:hypothetical protein